MNNTDELLTKVKDINQNFVKFRQSGTSTPFLAGELLTLECEDSDGHKETIYCYLSNGRYKLFLSLDAVLTYQKSKQRPKINLNINFVAGFIAIMITTTICYISWVNTERNIEFKIPEILSNALATIIGFYFGSQITAAQKEE